MDWVIGEMIDVSTGLDPAFDEPATQEPIDGGGTGGGAAVRCHQVSALVVIVVTEGIWRKYPGSLVRSRVSVVGNGSTSVMAFFRLRFMHMHSNAVTIQKTPTAVQAAMMITVLWLLEDEASSELDGTWEVVVPAVVAVVLGEDDDD